MHVCYMYMYTRVKPYSGSSYKPDFHVFGGAQLSLEHVYFLERFVNTE